MVAYVGFEPSGRMHIAQGVMKALNVNKLTKCGVTFKFWVADWFALMNNKMGGDLAKIQTVGRYMCEVWEAVGMDMSKVQFLSSSEEINGKAAEYWPLVLDIARQNSLQRIVRCSQIMGRGDTDELSGACGYPAAPSASNNYPLPHLLPLRSGQSRRYIDPCSGCRGSPTLPGSPGSPRCCCNSRNTLTLFGDAHLPSPTQHSQPDLLPLHAVRRHFFPQGGHLPARHGPAKGVSSDRVPCLFLTSVPLCR